MTTMARLGGQATMILDQMREARERLEPLLHAHSVLANVARKIASETCDHGPMPAGCPRELLRDALAALDKVSR